MRRSELPELPDDWYELERPRVSEQHLLVRDSQDAQGPVLVLEFTDPLARAWWKGWLESKRGYAAFGDWVDGRR